MATDLATVAATPSAAGQGAALGSAINALVDLHTIRMQKFVHHYLQSIDAKGQHNGAEAARLAGYEATTANRTAARLLKMPAIRAAIVAVRAASAATTVYSLDTLMRELEVGMQGAAKTDQWSAYGQMAQTRGKAMGLIVDRLDARVAVGSFSLVVRGLDAERSGA